MVLHEWYVIAIAEDPTCRYLIGPCQSDPEMIKKIVDAVTIPVMAKVRIGHFVEAQVKNYAHTLTS